MNCAACGTENSATAKFCRGCGASLSAAAPAAAPAAVTGRVSSGGKPIAWIVGVLVIAGIAGGGGYAWHQHVEGQRAAEEDSARQAEQRAAAEKQARKPARKEAERTVQYDKDPAEATKAAAQPKAAQPRPAAATPVALRTWASECASIPEGLKKTWCEERAKEKFCAANPRAAECR